MIDERMVDERPSISIPGVLFYLLWGSLGLEIGFVLHFSLRMAQCSKSNNDKKSPVLEGAKVLI